MKLAWGLGVLYHAIPMWIIGTATAVVIRGTFTVIRLVLLLAATPFVVLWSVARRVF